jgi:phosphopantothenoylcysteine decarboxylase/phosphopantothenate--cysteine ligase
MATEQRTQNDLRVDEKSNALAGITFGICVGGGIAALETPKLARELRRLGARVRFIATETALEFVGRKALEWASDNTVIIESSGLAQHIATDDAVLVFPATVDLIGKAAHGICPDACSTYIQSALGEQLPVFFLPTMHDSLRNSPAFKNNVSTLSAFASVSFISPRVEEGKWKAPSTETLALELTYQFNRLRWQKTDGLSPVAIVTLGGTHSNIDVARTVTNRSTGTLGSLVTRSLLENGIAVKALCGNMSAKLDDCSGLERIVAAEFNDMETQLKKHCSDAKVSALFHLAAVSDYAVESSSTAKLSSSAPELNLKLKRLPKLISMPEIAKVAYRVGCKFTSSNDEGGLTKARALINDHKLNSVFWNWGESAFGSGSTQEGLILHANGSQTVATGKLNAAELMVQNLVSYLKKAKSEK